MTESCDHSIACRGVRVHNLQNIDIDIPHRCWTTFCGVSGSGKTSLAFDTLYAEGQRRFISSFSVDARQFLDQIRKPEVESIQNLLPAVAVRSEKGTPNPYSNVGTATEILDYLRILFAENARPICPHCESTGQQSWPESIAAEIREWPPGTKFLIAFSIPDDDRETLAERLEYFREQGFGRALFDHQSISLRDLELKELTSLLQNAHEPDCESQPNQVRELPFWIIVDRLIAGNEDGGRFVDSLETAFDFGQGTCTLFSEISSSVSNAQEATNIGTAYRIDQKEFFRRRYSKRMSCGKCGYSFEEAVVGLFNFNSSLGGCPECKGRGVTIPKSKKEAPMECSTCKGARLVPAAREYFWKGQNLPEFCSQTVLEILETLESAHQSLGTEYDFHWRQILGRLRYLQDSGLGYLTLDRPLSSLSHGEHQRVRLTTALASDLVNTLYVLDEPTRGLHAENVSKLCESVRDLVERKNTVIVVDHDPSLIRSADRVIELGPGPGQEGGQVEFVGTPSELAVDTDSVTGQFFSGKRGFITENRRKKNNRWVGLEGASGNNLKNLDVRFPMEMLCVVTGVSGAGKSSLVTETLYPAMANRLENRELPVLPFDTLTGSSGIDEVMLIDESPIGRSSRSNPVTYVKAFDDIRKCFASTVDAKTRNLTAGHFSFNVEAGRCSNCRGDGYLVVDMQFMPNVNLVCEACRGNRFRDEVLEVRYRGKNIIEVLDLSIREAFTFFRGQPKIQSKLNPLMEVGLGYLKLGQRATTLSTGESQRLKMAYYLGAAKSKRTLFIMNEPAAGLHMKDIIKLLDCFESLLAIGHSIIVIEHHLQMIANADWIIDLGPGAGDEGGQLVAEGPPETIAATKESLTGQHLKPLLEEYRL